MADYYPLIARAVDGLADRSQPMRQAVYNRARQALIGQLRSYDPPLPEETIEQERLKLEAAIDRVEAAQHAPAAPPPVRPPLREPAREPEPAPPAEPQAQPARPPTPRSPPALPQPARLQPEPEPAAPPAVQEPAPSRQAPGPDTLGEPPPEPSPDAAEPEQAAPDREPRPPSVINLPRAGRQSPPGAVVLAAPTPSGPATVPDVEIEVPSDVPYVDWEPARPSFPGHADQPARPRVETRPPAPPAGGRARVLVLGTILLLVIAAIAIAAWHLRDTPVAELPPGPVAQSEEPPQPGKIEDRIGGGAGAPAVGAPSSAATVRSENAAQQAILYEEDAANPQVPKAAVGRVSWRLEPVSTGQGQPLDTAIRADIEVKDAGFSLGLLFRRNLDPSLPASHTVELTFTTPVGDPGRVVRDVGLLQFKQDVSARGTPIAGLPVPVRENLFLIGFSNLPADIERNLDLMRREWLDLPIRFASGQRAIVSFQKGAAGTQVVADALRQWQ
jgi:hypothetical protein